MSWATGHGGDGGGEHTMITLIHEDDYAYLSQATFAKIIDDYVPTFSVLVAQSCYTIFVIPHTSHSYLNIDSRRLTCFYVSGFLRAVGRSASGC